MARRTFFSFHYERDIWRASIVRNSWVTKPDREAAGFWDASLWEEAQKKGEDAVKRMIDKGLENTSVTAVLIGAETYARRWVIYEIEQSLKRSNGLLGINIFNIKDMKGNTDWCFTSPLEKVVLDNSGFLPVYANQRYPTYDWVHDDGYNKLGDWVESAFNKAQAARSGR
jgi:hypothetical protein